VNRGIALAAVACCACAGATTGTVSLQLATAPGSHVLDAVQVIRMTITSPRQVSEAPRTATGFDLALEVDATGGSGAVIVEGFDAGGAVVACGQSPAFPVAAINAHIVVYMAAPNSVAAAPVALDAPRSEIAGVSIGYGVVVAGGRDASGAPSTAIAIYNSYDHTLISGIAMPGPRAGLSIAAATNGAVYLFGGAGADGAPTGTLWRFETTVAPNGAYIVPPAQAGFARTGQLMVPIGSERFLITGTPALTLTSGVLAARTDVTALPPVGAAALPASATPTAIFAGDQVVRFRGDAFETLAGTGRSDATAVALGDGRIVLLGGGSPASRDALVIDSATGVVSSVPDVLGTPRLHPSLAATSRHLVVAGGTDAAGAPIATAEVLDATTLALIATVPIIARSGAVAVALPNDQVMIAGGAPASAQIELFTPGPPSL
jgi:hypothetical protein